MANFKMAIFGTLAAAAALSAVTAAPALAQAVISEPGYCAFFYPNANCQNKGPGNPYTDPNYQRRQNAVAWHGDQTVVVAPRRRARRHTATTY
jgi:ABC-type multidrug transport system permease subunit